MTPYEDAAREKDALYARIQLVRSELAQERDFSRREEQKARLNILRVARGAAEAER